MAKIWTASTLPAPQFTKWDDLASNGDGTKLAICEYGGKVYLSDDSGANWSETNPQAAGDRNWWSIDSSLDGSVLVVAAFSDSIYYSDDRGNSWADVTPAAAAGDHWITVSCSDDGSFIAAYENDNGELYVSSNSGSTWALSPLSITNLGGGPIPLDMSSDGSCLVSADDFFIPGKIYVSTDSGASWTGFLSMGSWSDVAISSDGATLIACSALLSTVFTSANGGVDWTERTPDGGPGEEYSQVASNAGGDTLTVSTQGGRIYTSSDSGVNWTETRPDGDANKEWYRLVAGKTNGTLFTYITPGTAAYVFADLFTFAPPVDIVTNKRLIAFSNDTLYYEDI